MSVADHLASMSIDSDAAPPSVLIISGLSQGVAAAFLAYLWDLEVAPEKRRASCIRLVDKFLVLPEQDVFLRYVDPAGRKVLKEGHGKGVEYVQCNLQNAEARTKVFTPPASTGKKAWDIVLDLSSSEANITSSEEAQIEAVAKVAAYCGAEAVKNGGVGAYVRWVPPFFTQPKKKCPLKEDDQKARPICTWTRWSMEGARALAAVPDLNLVLARTVNPWGQGALIGLTRRMTIASIYKYLGPGNTMEFLWGKDLVLEHIHTYDQASAFYALAQWMRLTARGRKKAEELAGCSIPPCRPGVIPEDELGDPRNAFAFDNLEIPDLVKREQSVSAPFFNVTDGSGMTQGEVGEILSKVMGIKVDYYSALTNALAKSNMREVVEVANEMHVGPWYEMLSAAGISNTPLSPSLPDIILRKSRCHLDSTKMHELTGWKPKYPRVTAEEVKRTMDSFIKDGVWPVVKPRKGK